jgi:hypothetical protein
MIGMIEITGFAKKGGPLTKRIALGPNGKPSATARHVSWATAQLRG